MVFVGCKKDEDEDPDPTPSSTDNFDLLTANAWKRNSIKFDPPLDTFNLQLEEIFPFLATCFKDNLSYYNTDFTGRDDEGGEKCQDTDPQERLFDWEWTNDAKTSLVMNFDEDVYLDASFNLGKVINMTDMVITESTLTANTVLDYNGTTYNIKVGFEKP